mmetsp:Transcript_1375/g.5908  ORF Transcript_1375/g.5908 Transcript_1375/m.5908 type:complete len:358 (+) Transcript_1375:1722-2795(+)
MQSNLEAVLPAQRGVGNRTEVPHRHHGDGREDGHDAAVDADGVRHGLQLLLERGVRRFHREVRLDAAPARVASDRNDDTECVAVEHLAAGQQERILPFRFGLLLRLASETALVADASRASADDGIRCDLVAGLQLQDVAHDDILDADLLLHAIANDLDLHIFPHGVQFPELQLLAVVIGGRNHRHNQDGYEDRRSLDPALGRVVVEADGKRDHRADDEHDQGGVVEAVDEEIQPGLRLRRRNLVPAIHLSPFLQSDFVRGQSAGRVDLQLAGHPSGTTEQPDAIRVARVHLVFIDAGQIRDAEFHLWRHDVRVWSSRRPRGVYSARGRRKRRRLSSLKEKTSEKQEEVPPQRWRPRP